MQNNKTFLRVAHGNKAVIVRLLIRLQLVPGKALSSPTLLELVATPQHGDQLQPDLAAFVALADIVFLCPLYMQNHNSQQYTPSIFNNKHSINGLYPQKRSKHLFSLKYDIPNRILKTESLIPRSSRNNIAQQCLFNQQTHITQPL